MLQPILLHNLEFFHSDDQQLSNKMQTVEPLNLLWSQNLHSPNHIEHIDPIGIELREFCYARDEVPLQTLQNACQLSTVGSLWMSRMQTQPWRSEAWVMGTGAQQVSEVQNAAAQWTIWCTTSWYVSDDWHEEFLGQNKEYTAPELLNYEGDCEAWQNRE